jgi:hypothetical protein
MVKAQWMSLASNFHTACSLSAMALIWTMAAVIYALFREGAGRLAGRSVSPAPAVAAEAG